MDQKVVGIAILVLIVGLIAGAVGGWYSQQAKIADLEKAIQKSKEAQIAAWAPLTVDEKAKEIRFVATIKKPEHPAGYEPTKFSHPNALVNETSGSALPASALVAEEGVTAEKLTEALKKLGYKAGQNISLGEKDKTADGDSLKVYIDTGSKKVLFDDVLKGALSSAKTEYVFLGNDKVQQKMGCGCLICGRSGPGTVLANASYTTTEEALIGPTLHAGLLKLGLKDSDKVTIVIKG